MHIPSIKIRWWIFRPTISAKTVREVLIRLVSEYIPWAMLSSALADSMHISTATATQYVNEVKDWLVAQIMEDAEPKELEQGGD